MRVVVSKCLREWHFADCVSTLANVIQYVIAITQVPASALETYTDLVHVFLQT